MPRAHREVFVCTFRLIPFCFLIHHYGPLNAIPGPAGHTEDTEDTEDTKDTKEETQEARESRESEEAKSWRYIRSTSKMAFSRQGHI
jgi:hypothetical protein